MTGGKSYNLRGLSIPFLLIILTVICQSPVVAWYDCLNEYTDPTSPNPPFTWDSGGWTGLGSQWNNQYIDIWGDGAHGNAKSVWITGYPTASNYFGFTESGQCACIIVENNVGSSYGVTSCNCGFNEFFRVDQKCWWWLNGVNQSAGFNCPTGTIYNWTIRHNCWPGNSDVDNFVLGGTDDLHIEHPPSSWYMLRDMKDPGLSGFYNGSTYVSGETISINVISGVASSVGMLKLIGPNGNVYSSTWANGSYNNYLVGITGVVQNASAPYGRYGIQYNVTGASNTPIEYYMYLAGSSVNDISWSKDTYVITETAEIDWSVANDYWDTIDYNYYVKIYDEDIVETQSWEALTQFGTKYWSTSDKEEGTYFCALLAEEEGGGGELYWLSYDEMTLQNAAVVYGVKTDILTGEPLANVTINISAAGTWYNTTTNATGWFSVSGMPTGVTASIYENLTGYTPIGWPEYWEIDGAGIYNVTWGMYNSSNVTWNGTAISGISYDSVYYSYISGCNITISNATWNSTTTSSDTGWYIFENLTDNSSYTINCTKTGYYCANQTPNTGYWGNMTYQNLPCGPRYTLTVRVKDITTGALVLDPNCTVTLTQGTTTTTKNCVNGVCTFDDVTYGYYSCQSNCGGYYASDSADVAMTCSKTQDCYMQSLPSGDQTNVTTEYPGGAGLQYPPHQVRFLVTWLWGSPIEGVTVTATPIESSTPWAWVAGLLGINNTSVDIQNTTLSGTTGTDGSWDTMMLESVRYRVTFVNATKGINQTIMIWPKEENYHIVCLPTADRNITGDINWSLNATPYNGTHFNLSLYYNDPNSTTKFIRFYTRWPNGTYLSISNNTGTWGVFGAYQYVNITNGSYKTWGFDSNGTGFQENLTSAKSVAWPKDNNSTMLLTWNAYGQTVPAVYYDWAGVALIICIGGLASYTINKFVAIFMVLFADLWAVLGWFPTMMTSLNTKFGSTIAITVFWTFFATATVLAFLFYSRKTGEEHHTV